MTQQICPSNMRWQYTEYDPDTNTALHIVLSEQDIIDKYYDTWKNSRLKRGESDITMHTFINEWKEHFYSWKVE